MAQIITGGHNNGARIDPKQTPRNTLFHHVRVLPKSIVRPAFQALSFEERFGFLVDLEWSRRKNSRLASLIRKADFKQSNACIEDVEYHAGLSDDKNKY
ncbi:IstB-like ATP-binding domain-containing protein [Cohnella endophytica]|uniref:IstB-like ATP-binding domain-containing protein n=1 Tax=Cohnella endophytica TaxID=2419778 RepID=UPI0018F740C2|nr:IstB-like ATP-binding domain-containing protein [Cohnella endophytica]